jgi:hypothetical protein
VDVAPGQPFEAHFVDLNNDGKLEIIASAFDTRYTVKKVCDIPVPSRIWLGMGMSLTFFYGVNSERL